MSLQIDGNLFHLRLFQMVSQNLQVLFCVNKEKICNLNWLVFFWSDSELELQIIYRVIKSFNFWLVWVWERRCRFLNLVILKLKLFRLITLSSKNFGRDLRNTMRLTLKRSDEWMIGIVDLFPPSVLGLPHRIISLDFLRSLDLNNVLLLVGINLLVGMLHQIIICLIDILLV